MKVYFDDQWLAYEEWNEAKRKDYPGPSKKTSNVKVPHDWYDQEKMNRKMKYLNAAESARQAIFRGHSSPNERGFNSGR